MRPHEAAPILPIQLLPCEHRMHRMTGRSGEISDAGAGIYVFDLIGAFRLRAPDGADLTPLGRKARGLLAYLALNPGSAV